MTEILSAQDIKALIVSRLKSGPATNDELAEVLEWAEGAILDHALLRLVLEERVVIAGKNADGDFEFAHNGDAK